MPVNPRHDPLLGDCGFERLRDMAHAVDIVDVYGPTEDGLPFAQAAVWW